jgi:hypothetical protein
MTRYCPSMIMETEVLTEMLVGMADLAHIRLQHRQLKRHPRLGFVPMHHCGLYPFRRLLGIWPALILFVLWLILTGI